MKRSKKGFTLVELLVVIGIIALLISILLPALSRARAMALRVKCAANLRTNGQALYLYANNNKGKLPYLDTTYHDQSLWAWDVAMPIREQLLRYGATRQTLYCPNYTDQDRNSLWDYAAPNETSTPKEGGYSVLGYVFMFKRSVGGGSVQSCKLNYAWVNNHMWIPQITVPKLSSYTYTNYTSPTAFVGPRDVTSIVLAADGVISFTSGAKRVFAGYGGNPVMHRTPHMDSRRGEPEGANILYLDGHVTWRDWKDILNGSKHPPLQPAAAPTIQIKAQPSDPNTESALFPAFWF